MKTKMNKIIGLLKHGDLGRIADLAKMNQTAVTNVLHGRSDLESYPSLVAALTVYVARRVKELQDEQGLTKQLEEAYKSLKLKEPTDEEILRRGLNWFTLEHMNEARLLEVNEKLNLRISVSDCDDWDSDDWADFTEKVGVKVGLKKREEKKNWLGQVR